MRPDLSRVNPFYHNYINQVPESSILEAFRTHTARYLAVFSAVPEDKRDYRYGPGKWTIREMLQHIIDTERVFAYRALCFARKGPEALPGFDENVFADNSKASTRDWDDLLAEFSHVRESSRLLFASFDEEQLESAGISNGSPAYVRVLGYTLLGHVSHHLNILEQRYL
ncbi:MAG: DinB family protein [Chitinophagaceae bacterium]|nr:MAG: DinB family protein [Chitinophagaceae bacterium]